MNATESDQRAVTVVFAATGSDNNLGIWSERLNFFGSGSGTSFSEFDPTDTYVPGTPTRVVAIGDAIPGLGSVTGFSVFDPINSHDRGDVAFWASSGTQQAVILARPKQVVYLDFNPPATFASAVSSAAQGVFNGQLHAPVTWAGGSLSSYFAVAAAGRSELNGTSNITAIEKAVAGLVQQHFDAVGARVTVLNSAVDGIPTATSFDHIFIGSSGNTAISSTLNGLSSSVDLFNQGVYSDVDRNQFLYEPDTAIIFADGIFGPGRFTDGNGRSVNLNQQVGPGTITVADVESALSDIIGHETGHLLGLGHLSNSLTTLLMKKNTSPDNLRSPPQVYSTTGNPLAEVSGAQNDQQRLALSVGNNNDSITRAQPEPAYLKLVDRVSRSVTTSIQVGAISLKDVVIGVIPAGDDDIAPRIIDLGGGDFTTLLRQPISVGPNDRFFVLGSTTGTGIDIFSTGTDLTGTPGGIDLSNGLFALANTDLRGDLSDGDGHPLGASLNLFRRTATGTFLIGTAGTASVPVTLSFFGDNRIYLRQDADGTELDVWQNVPAPGVGPPSQKVPFGTFEELDITGSVANDSLTLDFSNGDPFPPSTIVRFDGGAGSNTLSIVGTSGDDALTASVSTITVSTMPGVTPVTINVAGVRFLQMPGGSGGNDDLTLTGGAYTLDVDTPGGMPNVAVTIGPGATGMFTGDQHLASLTVNGGAAGIVTATRQTLSAAAVSVTGNGALDLGDNDLLTNSPIAAIRVYLLAARTAAGIWTGPGIGSALARGHPSRFTIGYVDGNEPNSSGVPAGTVLLRPTLVGDADLDRMVGFADLVAVAQNYGAAGGATFRQGDFNYDGSVGFADLVAVAQNYGATMPAAVPAATVLPAAAAIPVIRAPLAIVRPVKGLFSVALIVKPEPLKPKPIIRPRHR